MEAPESHLVPGYRLDRYELLCPIASGGMASVWLARLRGKRGFEKLFAIKTIKTELTSDPTFQEMFLDEARIASRIIHPNVAQIVELGEQADVLYLVMEYVDGDSVAKISRLALKKGFAIPPTLSMRIVADACAGLHAAHQVKDELGESLLVVHRDVSPQNILLATDGNAKVIDFGLVKAKNRSSGETGQGIVKGKIRYMAPEQVHAKGIDHRADVWAAGMCLYELLVGHPPYHQEDDLEVVKRLMGPDPLPPFDVAFPAPIEKVLRRALVKDPAGRYESCAQMRRGIEHALHELGLEAEPEHIAEFLESTLPELASKRAKTIAQATVAAGSRLSQVDSLESLGPADMAFANTEVSAREPTSDDTLPLTRRLPSAADSDGQQRVSSPSYGNASRSTSAVRLADQLGERKRRRSAAPLIATLTVMSVGGWILWPRPTPTDQPTAAALSASAAPTAVPSASAASTASPVTPVIEVDATTIEVDSLADDSKRTHSTTPTGRVPITAADAAAADTKPTPTYNPAWSILTNPPEAGVPPTPQAASAAPSAAPAPSETHPVPAPTPPAEEPK